MQRISCRRLEEKVMSANQAASFIKDGMVVGSSGFTKGGDSKSILKEYAEQNRENHKKITLITGASLGLGTDASLVENKAISRRMPFQVDRKMREAINKGEMFFSDQHLSETVELIRNKILHLDIAIIEIAGILEDGSLIPTTSIGNNVTFLEEADQILLEINTLIPLNIKGIHDNFNIAKYPNTLPIQILKSDDRIGSLVYKVDVNKIAGIVYTNIEDEPADITPADENTKAIAQHILNFLESEVEKGNLSEELLPLQCGIGKVANAVLSGFKNSSFKNLTMYSEVLQDSTFELIESGKLVFASASSLTLSSEWYHKLLDNLDEFRDKILLRPQNISNAPEVIKRLNIIGINTALECDIYGNVNSTHVNGTHMMNGIGGSGDFARNAAISIFVTSSTAKKGDVSCFVPMVSHTDHTEHDVDILVSEIGLADLRGLAPKERAQSIIDNVVHPDYRDQLQDYFDRATSQVGGQTPHLLEEIFSWHIRLQKTGSMKKQISELTK